MDQTDKLYDTMFLWHELGELSRLLQHVAMGAFGIYAIWIVLDGLPDKIARMLIAAGLLAVGLVICQAGIWLSRRMKQNMVDRLNQALYGKDGTTL